MDQRGGDAAPARLLATLDAGEGGESVCVILDEHAFVGPDDSGIRSAEAQVHGTGLSALDPIDDPFEVSALIIEGDREIAGAQYLGGLSMDSRIQLLRAKRGGEDPTGFEKDLVPLCNA